MKVCHVPNCSRKHYARGLCEAHYKRLQRSARVRPIDERFWEKVSIGLPDECWEWTAHRRTTGYGQFRAMGMMAAAHRIAWMLTRGPIPDGLLVCHHCDNPPCCNPLHMFLGTHQDNSDDCHAKSRGVSPPGEASGMARLTERAVIEIRSVQRRDDEYAEKFGVSKSTVARARAGKSWRHLAIATAAWRQLQNAQEDAA